MVSYRCDGCGGEIPKDALRYMVRIDVHAAYDELEVGLLDLVRDHRQEILDLIERLKQRDPKEIEREICANFKLDLCSRCQRVFVLDPLHFHPERGPATTTVDIDAFLRSLGYGKADDEGKQPCDMDR